MGSEALSRGGKNLFACLLFTLPFRLEQTTTEILRFAQNDIRFVRSDLSYLASVTVNSAPPPAASR